ncbi:MAG: radical SAM protein [Elusimicrobia bacterium]|nr:radical SAM protein [Elusimicrobiota bacterium]
MLKAKDDLSWYARKADGLRGPCAEGPGAAPRARGLLDALKAGGVKGSIDERTLYTRRLPPGCRGCLLGRGTNLYVTGLCTRECFFCFNEKPRRDEIVAHGIRVENPGDAAEIVERYGLASVGISGGEPLLFPERVLGILRSLRKLPRRIRVDLYTNGDRASEALLSELKEAGLDSVRVNLVANGFDLAPLKRALRLFPESAVEVPVVPDLMEDLKRMVLDLDKLGAPFLILHELFAAGAARRAGSLLWSPVQGAEEAALDLLLFALKRTRRLSAYYCSCLTQESISRRGLARRGRAL